MILAEIAAVAVETALVVGTAGISTLQALQGGPVFAASCSALCALALLLLARFSPQNQKSSALVQAAMLAAAVGLMASAVTLSHAASRMEHRAVLSAFTGLHHLGTAAWIGAMPFLLITLKRTDDIAVARQVVRRFSRMAMTAAALLLGAGIGAGVVLCRVTIGIVWHDVWRAGDGEGISADVDPDAGRGELVCGAGG